MYSVQRYLVLTSDAAMRIIDLLCTADGVPCPNRRAANMLATRCKFRWPGAVAAVGSPSFSLSPPTLTAGPSPRLRIRARARCFGTTASPEGGQGEDEEKGHGSFRGRLSQRQIGSVYTPCAYEPEPMSYADILTRAVSEPVWRSSRILRQLHAALQPGDRFSADESSLPLEQVLDRSLIYLTSQSEQIHSALAAVSQDVSSHLVPKVHTDDFAAIRTHHLGRWYASGLGLQAERVRVKAYLDAVTGATTKARSLVASPYSTVEHALHVQKAALKRAIQEHRSEFEAVVYNMACELKVARRASQWHKVWTLESKLASTASVFLPSRPLDSVCQHLLNEDDGRMAEISMSRMAEWDDSYKSLYVEDVYTRKRMNLVKRYWTVLNSPLHEKPWQGEAVIFAAKPPIGRAREFIVLRHDQSRTPSPLWPRVWKPVVRTETPDGSSPAGVAHKIKTRAKPTPPATGRKRTRKKKTGKGSKSKSQEESSLDMHANSNIPEA